MKTILLILSALFLSACASQSVMPDKEEVKVSRETPKDCKDLGKVTGTSGSVKPDRKAVLEDMKQDAANKGANYVVVKQYSDNGTSVTGLAFQCN